MKVGQLFEISRDIFTYPYPGKSVNTISGRGFPAQRSSKKLMERVRPGVELVLANLAPTNELMTLDLPTFDRPRNAISGKTGAGKWFSSVADIMNRDRMRISQFAT